MRDEFITVPIVKDFDQDRVIGELRIRASDLPKSPNFVFSLGYKSGEPYRLVCVSPVSDDSYLGYLKTKERTPS